MLANHNVLRKCMRWWKTLFFHMIDIAVVNSFILFQIHRKANPDNPELKRPQSFSILEFREELVRDLAGLEEYLTPPVYENARQPQAKVQFETEHMIEFSEGRRSCKVCYKKFKTENKVHSFCSAPQCLVYLHCTPQRNCFKEWHSKAFHE